MAWIQLAFQIKQCQLHIRHFLHLQLLAEPARVKDRKHFLAPHWIQQSLFDSLPYFLLIQNLQLLFVHLLISRYFLALYLDELCQFDGRRIER